MPKFYFLPEEAPTPPTRRKRTLHGQKPPLKPREVWAIRTRLQIQGKQRDLALFNLAIDSKLRSCDLVALRDSDIVTGDCVSTFNPARSKIVRIQTVVRCHDYRQHEERPRISAVSRQDQQD